MMHMQPDPILIAADGRHATRDVTNQVDTTDPLPVSFEVAQIYVFTAVNSPGITPAKPITTTSSTSWR
jgi:hypothetical protein